MTVGCVDESWDSRPPTHALFPHQSESLVTVHSPPAVRLIFKLTCPTHSADGRRIKGDFSEADRGASLCRRTAGGLIKDVKHSVLARWLSVLCIRSAVSADTDTQNKHRDCLCFFLLFSALLVSVGRDRLGRTIV